MKLRPKISNIMQNNDHCTHKNVLSFPLEISKANLSKKTFISAKDSENSGFHKNQAMRSM